MYTLTEYEDNNLNVNHAIVSHFICKIWGLSDDTGLAILHHHDIEGSLLSTQQQKSESQTLIALLTMAEYISYAYHGRAGKTRWPEDASIVMDYLGLSEFDFERIKAQMFAKFAA